MSSELVVIIDDSATHLKILERLANSLGGWTVAKAFNDAEAALSFCRENRPGLVVLAAASAQGEAAGLIHKLHRIASAPKRISIVWSGRAPPAPPTICCCRSTIVTFVSARAMRWRPIAIVPGAGQINRRRADARATASGGRMVCGRRTRCCCVSSMPFRA